MHRTSSVRRFGAIVLTLVCAVGAHAQGLSLASDPDMLARAALGDERGVVAVGVWRDGQARYGLAAQGEAAASASADKTLFEIGSISKVFTGLLVAQAVERSELKLDDRLGDLLQGKVEFASPAVASITLRQLLTHSACLPRLVDSPPRNSRDVGAQFREFDRARVWSALGRLQIDQPPCRPSYSNLGFAILGELLAERAGRPWHVLVRDQITVPLGMHDTKVALGDDAPRLLAGFNGSFPAEWWEMKAYAGAGGLRSTAADMLRFSQAVFAGSKGPLGPAVDRLLTPLGPYQGGEVGYGVLMRGPKDKRTYGHSGLTGGFQSMWRLDADTGEALIVLASNAQARTGWLDTVIAASRYPVGAERIAIDAAALPQYNGVFRVAKELAFTFVAQEGVLYGRATGQAFQPLQPSADDTFVQPEIGARFTFRRSGEHITALRLDQGGSVVTASRADEPVPRRATLPEPALQPYVGRYRFAPDWEFIVRAEQGQLFVKSGNRVRQIVFPIDDQRDRFAYDIVDAQLEFERGSDGEVLAVVLQERDKRRAVRLHD